MTGELELCSCHFYMRFSVKPKVGQIDSLLRLGQIIKEWCCQTSLQLAVKCVKVSIKNIAFGPKYDIPS